MSKRVRRGPRKRESSDTPPKPSPIDAVTGSPWLLPGLAVLALAAALYVFNTALSVSGDNAEFIILARSIVQGEGLTYINTLDQSPATKYPFGFPLILSVVEWLSPSNFTAMKALVALFFCAVPPLVYLVLSRAGEPAAAFGLAVFTACSAPLLDFSSQIMSEVPAAAISLLALWQLQRSVEGTPRDLLLLVLALAAAYYVRSASLALAGAAVVTFLLRRDGKRAGIVAGGFALLIAPWMIRNASFGGNSYIGQLLSVDPYRPEMGMLGVGGLFERAVANLQTYFLREVPRIFDPDLVAISPLWFGPPLLVFIIASLVVRIRRAEPVGVYVACYFGVHLLWPQVWSDLRFLLPALPLIAFVTIDGLLVLARRFDAVRPLAGRLAAAILVAGLAFNLASAKGLHDRAGRYPLHFQRYIDAAAWIAANTPPEAIVCCRKGFLMSVFSGRRTTIYKFSDQTDEVVRGLEEQNVDIVVVDQLGFSTTPRYLVPAIQGHQDRFGVLHTTADPRNWVLEFRKSP